MTRWTTALGAASLVAGLAACSPQTDRDIYATGALGACLARASDPSMSLDRP